MPNPLLQRERTRKVPAPIRILNNGVVTLSIAILVGFLLYLVLQAFRVGTETGIRSLAATALPLIAITYLTFFTERFRYRSRVPPFNLYFIFTVWTIILFILMGLLDRAVPFGELAISLTLCALLVISRNAIFNVFLSSAYGILTGFLLFIFFFGLPVG